MELSGGGSMLTDANPINIILDTIINWQERRPTTLTIASSRGATRRLTARVTSDATRQAAARGESLWNVDATAHCKCHGLMLLVSSLAVPPSVSGGCCYW